jgi:hypothetical protein
MARNVEHKLTVDLLYAPQEDRLVARPRGQYYSNDSQETASGNTMNLKHSIDFDHQLFPPSGRFSQPPPPFTSQ